MLLECVIELFHDNGKSNKMTKLTSLTDNCLTFPGGTALLQDLVYWGADRKSRWKIVLFIRNKTGKYFVKLRSKRMRRRVYWCAYINDLTFIRRQCKNNNHKPDYKFNA